ncbi:D-alanyl-D-alanine carboxypeptidase [Kaistia dalseonensis]|uniref:D-alanyl-D-alanine carboxypeptidase n=1 Tax=Kaistia dalseonensis TaxID=410840 RepID=A0ABU0H4K5_9HYPH|nr:D-alanyl-D-alanine carboxypeptidase family protein [Kaistia dalseonensis]MCX5494659.1 D-alanyl-D-alanine carboxypeptidase [Kaistia dalseonensis]MDQ0437240.1 D-alanyl-D-alanine carboxypeptidase [Kaistia dalseonensis]
MTRSITRFLAALLLIGFGLGKAAAIETPYIVVDMGSGKVLAQRNPYQLWYPASITKLMNAYVVFKALKQGRITLDTQVVVSRHALDEPPSKMGFKVGTVINLDNALKMMLVHSSNDIAMAIAETVGGSEEGFVAMMNAEAAGLGMTSSHFINPNGLPGPGQHTTARDLAVLAQALWTEYPEKRPLFGISAIRSGNKVMKSANTLLERYRGTVGMKTGFICSSGFNVVAVATRNGRTLAAVVLGSQNAKDRAELAGRLFNQGFGMLSLPGQRPTLANSRGSSPIPDVIDMRDEGVCKKKDRGENEADADKIDDVVTASALEPRFKLMEPVTVTTLGIRKADGSVGVATAADTQDDPPAVKSPKKPKATKKSTESKPKKAAVSKETKASAPAAAPKPQAKAAPKLEVGVPFESTDIAPLPDMPAPATQ